MRIELLGESILDQTLTKKKQILEIKKQQPWLVVNLLGAAFCSYHLWGESYFNLDLLVINTKSVSIHLRHKIPDDTTLTSKVTWYSTLVVCTILLLNFITGLILYIKRTSFDPPVILSPEQKQVLGVKNNGNHYNCY